MRTTGPLFNYDSQKWETIDTDEDARITTHIYRTETGMYYERNPENLEEYRFARRVGG